MRNSIISAALILSTATLFAQQLPFSSQYYTNPFVTNPAFTGNHDRVNAFLTHRSQWTGVSGGPQTSYLTVDGPIEAKNIGLGLNLYSDVTDITSRIGAFANYSYKLKINDDNHVLLGLALGMLDNRIDFSKAIVRDVDDPYLLGQPQHKTVFSADFGLGYTWKKLEIGFAIPQVIGNKIKFNNNDGNGTIYNMARHYQGSIKYVFDLVKEKEITAYPLIMVRGVAGAPIQYDANLVLDWKKIGWVGVTYHSNYAVAVSAGVRFKNLSVGYAYDLGITKIKSYTGSTSEFLLSYSFGGKQKDEETLLREAAEKAAAQKAAAEKDSLTNMEITQLKVKSDTNKAEIDRLKAEVAKLKTEGVNNNSHSDNLTENLMRSSSNTDFVDENGEVVGKGFYVVIGTFSNKENAEKFKQANSIKGYKVHTIRNQKTNVFYVHVLKTDNKPDALTEYNKFKAEYPDVWIQNMQ